MKQIIYDGYEWPLEHARTDTSNFNDVLNRQGFKETILEATVTQSSITIKLKGKLRPDGHLHEVSANNRGKARPQTRNPGH